MSDSPFRDGVQYAWDSTSLGWLKTCPRLYYYQMLEGWRAKGDHVHLTFGTHYHSALEFYDHERAVGQSHNESVRQTVLKTLNETWNRSSDPPGPWRSDHPAKTRENLIRSIIWYLDEFEVNAAQTMILANGKPAVELSFRFEVDDWLLCGHLDKVATYLDDAYVVDRKTTGSSPGPYYFDGFSPDNQMTLYTIASKVVFGSPVKGVMIDAAQIAVGFTRFARGFTFRTEAQCDEWLSELPFWRAQVATYVTSGTWPMNDKSCNLYGGCAFRRICSKDPRVREKFLETDFERRPWNPLEVR